MDVLRYEYSFSQSRAEEVSKKWGNGTGKQFRFHAEVVFKALFGPDVGLLLYGHYHPGTVLLMRPS